MAKLNFYDTDAVKAFVLDILIENAELKSDLDYEKKCSNDWFDRYKKADPVIEQAIEREVKLCDKLKALELCGRHLGMFKDNPEANVPVTVVINYDYGGED